MSLRVTDGDLNDDGIVNAIDFREWKSNFVGPLGGIPALPEPGGTVLALVGLVVWSSTAAQRRVKRLTRR